RELWPGTGNRESFRRSFFSRESIVLWTIRTYSKNRRKYLAEMARTDAGRRFKRLRSPRQAADFLRTLPQVHSSRR
ncbi:TPA: adenylate kinase, partial [Serratia marcescens]